MLSRSGAMSYAIHIERDQPISIDEWSAAVRARTDVRLSDAAVSAVNRQTGEVISVGRGPGAADVLVDDALVAWVPCFTWHQRGSISFRAPEDFDEPGGAVRSAAQSLAKALGARLVGDEGEEYE